MKTSDSYTSSFYSETRSASRQSAELVVPYLIEWVGPSSVVDLGCGMGEWLSVFNSLGLEDIWGVDGEYVLANEIAIPKEKFEPYDLSKPYKSGRKFDLAISLEVGEHLPESAAKSFVKSLTRLAPVVAFSAAIPCQGGVDHINCQWPSYWATLFSAEGYKAIDALRPIIWDEKRIDYWYRQNIILYISEDFVNKYPKLKEFVAEGLTPIPRIHPGLVERIIEWGTEWEMKYWELYEEMNKNTDA